MIRTSLVVNGSFHELAQGQDIDDLKTRIEGAVTTAGKFVEFAVVGNRLTSVLFGPRTQVVFSIETVQYDERDTGDTAEPWGGLYDF